MSAPVSTLLTVCNCLPEEGGKPSVDLLADFSTKTAYKNKYLTDYILFLLSSLENVVLLLSQNSNFLYSNQQIPLLK